MRALPEEFALPGNYPNPFDGSTQIAVDLPSDAEVTLEVYETLGRRILQKERPLKPFSKRSFDSASLRSG